MISGQSSSGIAPETTRVGICKRHFTNALARARDALRKPGAKDADSKLAQLARLEADYFKAWELRSAGWSVDRIAGVLQVKSVYRWFKGTLPRQLLNLDPDFRKKLEKPISIPTEPSPELAFIFGVFCGRSCIGGRYRGFELHSRDISLVTRLAGSFEKVLRVRGTLRRQDYRGTRYHYFRVGSNKLARYLVEATAQNCSVPLQQLATSECRRSFLQGFFSSCGSAIRPKWRKISVVKSRNSRLLSEVAVILKREGILALVCGDQRAELIIQDQNELDRINQAQLLSSPADISALAQICAAHPKRRAFTVEEYAIAMQLFEANPSIPCAEISVLIAERTTGRLVIDPSVLRQWRKGTTPASVKRARRLTSCELAMRSSRRAAKLQSFYEQQVRHMRDAEQVLPLLKELAWLRGEREQEFPLELPNLERFRELFSRLKLPFTDLHEQSWRAAAGNSLQQRIDVVPELANVASLKDDRCLFEQFDHAPSKQHRSPSMELEKPKKRLSRKVSEAKYPCDIVPLLNEMAALSGQQEYLPLNALPSLRIYEQRFQCLSLNFQHRHACGWHEEISGSLKQSATPIARGVHNLIRRQWDCIDSWIGELSGAPGQRCSRIIDRLFANRPFLQRDLIEVMALLGVERASPAMRYLVGLSIANESQVIAHLAETTTEIRAALLSLFRIDTESDFDSVHARLFDLLPGVTIPSIHQERTKLTKALHKSEVPLSPMTITESKVLDWLDFHPKYRSRLGQLTELARKAQDAGLSPTWAISMCKDKRSKPS